MGVDDVLSYNDVNGCDNEKRRLWGLRYSLWYINSYILFTPQAIAETPITS